MYTIASTDRIKFPAQIGFLEKRRGRKVATRQMIPAKNVMIDWGSHARHSVDQGAPSDAISATTYTACLRVSPYQPRWGKMIQGRSTYSGKQKEQNNSYNMEC
jgi:hypothetical protein